MKQQVGIDLGSALRSFIVRATLPETLAQLRELAYNLRWSWDRRTRDLFRSVDPHLWDVAYHDPVRLLTLVRPTRLDELAAEPAFIDLLGEMHADLTQYLEKPRWFESQAHSPLRSVAYFSAEFGITEALPQYSGGLGVVAGDHIKAASSLGIPLVGVGLMYRMGYFRQHVNQEGLQEEHYPVLEPHFLAADLVDDIRISLRLAGHDVDAQIWQIHVGRVKLYLLDADLDSNDEEFRAVTDRLFGGGSEHRLRQAILLGMGGVQALRAVGVETDVFHTNEGHAGFLGLERMHNLITQEKLSWHEAIEAVRAETAFTTYAPVPAGVDRFPRELMERYFSEWAEECGVSIDTLMSLGHFPGEEPSDPFNMAVMGLRLADKAIAVSKLHAQTSRAMFHSLWPAVTGVETPIISITNGVHGRTWVSSQIEDLYSNFVSPDWDDAGPNEWARIADAPDDEIWNIRQKGREALVNFVRARLRASLSNREELGVADRWVDEVLDPRFLIIGFARRFATYKRASLLLSQPDRLRSLLLNDEQPVQLVFAGKAHPADDLGKEIISQIIRYSTDLAVRHRIVYLEDYDISVARMLYQGSDVWLNTPRRPMEACGTSGQKAALNGALNVSILDGWWDEMFDGANGWAIASAESVTDLVQRDDFEANNLFETLEREVIPLFYDRRGMTYPSQWVRMIKSSIKSLAPRVEASRMVREYLSEVYEPLARRSDLLAADDYRRARELSAWKKAVLSAWPRVAVVSVEDSVEIGNDRHVTAEVFLAGLRPEDVSVQVLHGPLANDGGIIGAEAVPLSPHAPTKTGADVWEYKGSFRYQRFGRYGYELRVVPAHPDLGSPFELGLTTWS